MNKRIMKVIITTLVAGTIGQYTMYLVDMAISDYRQDARRELQLRSRRREYDFTTVQ